MSPQQTYLTIKSMVKSFLPGSKVLLFGSRARGESNLESDYDLLIITSNTFEPRIKMGWENKIRKALVYSLKAPFDVIVESEDEIKEKERFERAYYILCYERGHRIMTEAELKHLNQWIEKAEHDLMAAKLIIDHQPIILDIACFHCQQAVEKYLKTYLVFKKVEFPRTHNLDLLLQSCSEYNQVFESIDLKNLEDFAVRGRYPHDFLMPEPDETKEFYQIALQIKATVMKEIDRT